MKYLKYSVIVLVLAVALNMSFASAYTNTPITFTREVSRLTVGQSQIKTKDTGTEVYQSFVVLPRTANYCEGCTYTAYPVNPTNDYRYKARGNIEIDTTSKMQSDSSAKGDYYIEFYRDDASIFATKKLGYFVYDPNAMSYK